MDHLFSNGDQKTLDINFFAGRGSSASMQWGIGRMGGVLGGEGEPEVLGVGEVIGNKIDKTSRRFW